MNCRCKRCGVGNVSASVIGGLLGGWVASCDRCAHPAMNLWPTRSNSPESAIRKWNGEEH